MDKIIFFTTLVLFPFGQLFKISNPLWGGMFNLFDALVVLLAIITILKKPKYPDWYRYFICFILACVFSLLFNYKLVDLKSVLYLVRLISYSFVAIYINNYFKEFNLKYLLLISIFSAIFGWFQYFLWPDLTSLKYLGWDDHLLRMIGTFLDPTYLGLIIVLGMVISLYYDFKKILYFLLMSLAFTYSRSSYLIASLLLVFKKKYVGLIIFSLSILLLPKMIGEGTNLLRTVSGNNKIVNYKETIEIFKKSPLFGVGFNNICVSRKLYLNDLNTESHSCNGSDSSILFLLATTGIVGFILFINFIRYLPNIHVLQISFLAIFIHSLFSNSLFYPHIMFWLFVIIGLGTEVNSKT